MEVVQRQRRTWWWVAGIAAMISLSGCGMYPSSPGKWPGGWWGSILQFVSSVMDWTAAHITGGSYGLALLIVTVLVRLIIFPLMVKQIRYQKVMQAMQPEIQKIRQKHQGDNQKIQQETMKLWQAHGVNPMTGCFPMIVQLPVLYALFGAIEGNTQLNQSTFLHIFQLGQHDHTYILPLIAAITTFISSRLSMAGVEGQQKMMLYIMPVMIFFIGSRFPAGLALYWIYTNLFTAVQTYFVKVRPAAAASASTATVTVPATGGGGKAKKNSSSDKQKPSQVTKAGDSRETAKRNTSGTQRSRSSNRGSNEQRNRKGSRNRNESGKKTDGRDNSSEDKS